MFKLKYYLILLALISVFLFSCSDPQIPLNQHDKEIPTQLIAPTSTLDQKSALRLGRQIQLLTNNSNIVTISNTKSMVPVLDDNSIAIIEKIFIFNSLNVGDIIVYRCNSKDSIYYNKNIIHRIYSIDLEQNSLRAKGDNCPNIDYQIISSNEIVGRVFCIIYSSESIN